MKLFRFIILFLAALAFPKADAQTALKATDVLTKTVTKIMFGDGAEAKFTITNSGHTGSGEIKTAGNKFTVSMPDASVWYNGKDLYTYNGRTNETTIVVPTPEELAESNPLAYLSGASTKYNVTYSTVKKAGKYVIELTPKSKGEIKRITLTVDKTSFLPEKMVVEPKGGQPVTAEIKSFRSGVKLPPSTFEYPKAKYPKAEIVDLR